MIFNNMIFKKGLIVALGGIQTVVHASPVNYVPDDVLKAEGLPPASSRASAFSIAAAMPGNMIDRTGWTYTATSWQGGNEPAKAFDANTGTIWHTQYNPPVSFPQSLTIDMKQSYNVNGFAYLPRQDRNLNGNIGQHQIFVSADGVNWGNPVAFGTFMDTYTQKNTTFEPVPARYIRIVALTEAGNRGNFASAAEFNVWQASSYTAPNPASLGTWGPTINFPLVPAAAAVQPVTGKILTWSAYSAIQFNSGAAAQTVTSTYDPATQRVTQRTITNTGHDMFCPGISLDAGGRPIVTGGNNAEKTSIYDWAADSWIAAPNMNIARGYQASTTCSDGRVFTIGGSWSGNSKLAKNGEIYNPTAKTWSLLSGAPVAPMITADKGGVYRGDNHAWLFGWKNQYVFQAGPSKAMNWYYTGGNGAVKAAGNRANDGDSMCGIAVMYDAVAGRILTVGGSPDYQGTASTVNAHVITLGQPNVNPTVNQINNAWFNRIFHNSVVLPSGQVFIVGGQTVGNPFYEDGSQLTPEMWNPATTRFVKMAPGSVPRVYHSVALLMLDGTVFVGGSGLCGNCDTNHFDAQIYYPPYLYTPSGALATRPVINSLSASSVKIGQTLTINTNGAITGVSLVRYGSATHTVNTDQRRMPLTPTQSGTNQYTVTIPNDSGVALPGYWMVFVQNSAGVPSVAKTVLITI